MLILACKRITPHEIEPGTIITFNYAYPKTNPPMRVGIVDKFVGKAGNSCVLVWDFSIRGGPNYRSYRLSGLHDLACVIKISPEEKENIDLLSSYQQAIIKFRRNILGIP